MAFFLLLQIYINLAATLPVLPPKFEINIAINEYQTFAPSKGNNPFYTRVMVKVKVKLRVQVKVIVNVKVKVKVQFICRVQW